MFYFFKKVTKFILNRIYTNEILILYQMDKLIEQKSIALINFANTNNINDVLNFQTEKQLNTFKRFLKKGDIGYLGYINKKCIHRSWVKSNEQLVFPHWGLPYKLRKSEIIINFCETALEARGKNIYGHVLTRIIKDNLDKDILIAVNKKNIPSIKGIEKVGFKVVSINRILVIMGFKFKKKL